jgi:DNA-directed RNA polymerase specialized sigma subunit
MRRPAGVRDAADYERRLLLTYHETGDVHIRAELIERFLPLARDLALRYRHFDETQREIGRRVGFSQMHVSRLLRSALGRMTGEAA